MKLLLAYLKTLYQYLQTPKGKYDFFEDLRAIFIIVIVILAVMWILKQIES